MKPLWAHRDFRFLVVGVGLSCFGDAFAAIALAVALIGGGHSASTLGFVMAAFTVGQLVFLLVGGVLADRLSPTKVMVASDVGRALIAASLCAMFATGRWSTAGLAAVFLALGIISAFFSPAAMSLRQKIVAEPERKASNSVLIIVQTSAAIAGPAVAGVVVAAFGAPVGFALNALSFVASAACASAIRVKAAARTGVSSFFGDLGEGFVAISLRRWLRVEILCAFAYHLGNGVIMVLLQVVAITKLGGAASLGVIQTSSAVGGLLGGLVASKIRPARPLLVGGVLLVTTPLSLTPMIAPMPLLTVAVSYGIGVCALMVFSVLYETVLQNQVPEHVYARVVSWDMLGSYAVVPVGTALAGPLADRFGTSSAVSGVIVFMLVSAAAPVFVRDVRRVGAEAAEVERVADCQ